jgi:cation diffusion facilitator family transporter
VKRLKAGQKIALSSTILLFFLALLKAIVGIRFNSPLLVADAYHSGADILINFTSLLGLWFASRKKSTRFPYGLYRAETMACMLIGGFILYVGFEIFNDGLYKFFQLRHTEKFPVFPLGAALLSFVVAWVLAVKQKALGNVIGSQALLATAREAFFDIFTSLFVLVGIILVYAGVPYVEGAVICTISIFILKLGLETIWTSLMILLDANMDVGLQSEIEEKINKIYGVKGVGEVKIRRSGPFKMVECIIETSPSLSLYKAHEMADNAEGILLKEYDSIESVFIHMEPGHDNVLSAIIPVKDINGLSSRLHGHFGRAPYFIVLKINNDQTSIEDFYLNEFLNDTGHIGLKVVKTIINYKIDMMVVSQIGEISFHMLKNNFVDIYRADEGVTVEEIINFYRLKQLSNVTEPTHAAEKSQFAMLNRQEITDNSKLI